MRDCQWIVLGLCSCCLVIAKRVPSYGLGDCLGVARRLPQDCLGMGKGIPMGCLGTAKRWPRDCLGKGNAKGFLRGCLGIALALPSGCLGISFGIAWSEWMFGRQISPVKSPTTGFSSSSLPGGSSRGVLPWHCQAIALGLPSGLPGPNGCSVAPLHPRPDFPG